MKGLIMKYSKQTLVCTNLVRTVASRNIYRNFTPSNKMKTVQSCDKYCKFCDGANHRLSTWFLLVRLDFWTP